MFPILVIAIGVAVLMFGNRLAVLGAAVGALLGVGLLRLFPNSTDSLLTLLIPVLLAILGFFGAAFAKGIINIVLLVIGALAGAAIVLGFLDLFQLDNGLIDWLLVVIGGFIGLVLIQRFKDWAMIILAGLIGGLLVTRGLSDWFSFLEGAAGTLLALVLAGVAIAYQGGFLTGRKAPTDV
ncbi:MAG: hypothetical protein M9928_23725 [Anaerolineae bacterium]|nr:hypothetical protein [Anaerolineae bacterium]MCO5194725.1 hypothetical protein [Anaerolineae bacterium]MCO5208019.1 hypothetical protein [Anaerolineae bacterium]